MSSINSISNINSFYYPTFRQKQDSNIATNPISTNAPMNGLEATANYNIATVNKQNNIPKYITQTLEEHLLSLRAKGKKKI